MSSHSSRRAPPQRGGRHVVRLRGLTIVAVMQATDLRRDEDLAGSDTRRPAVRGVFAQAEMRAAPMVVGEIRAKHAAEMPVVEDDHVVQTLAANGADHALHVGILPRAERTRHDLGDAEAGDPPTLDEAPAVDGVAPRPRAGAQRANVPTRVGSEEARQ